MFVQWGVFWWWWYHLGVALVISLVQGCHAAVGFVIDLGLIVVHLLLFVVRSLVGYVALNFHLAHEMYLYFIYYYEHDYYYFY